MCVMINVLEYFDAVHLPSPPPPPDMFVCVYFICCLLPMDLHYAVNSNLNSCPIQILQISGCLLLLYAGCMN